MKLLLVQPSIQNFYQTSIRTQPIGLAYVAASLKSHGYEVEILDCQTERKKSIPIPSELFYLRDFYPFNDRSHGRSPCQLQPRRCPQKSFCRLCGFRGRGEPFSSSNRKD